MPFSLHFACCKSSVQLKQYSAIYYGIYSIIMAAGYVSLLDHLIEPLMYFKSDVDSYMTSESLMFIGNASHCCKTWTLYSGCLSNDIKTLHQGLTQIIINDV